MKYIRTDNGKLIDLSQCTICEELNGKPINPPKGWLIYREHIIKEANTIEELCDNIVVFDTHGDTPAILRRFLGSFDLKNWIESSKKQDNRYIFYGAIWTKWGLKYIAKMNEKGELELI